MWTFALFIAVFSFVHHFLSIVSFISFLLYFSFWLANLCRDIYASWLTSSLILPTKNSTCVIKASSFPLWLSSSVLRLIARFKGKKSLLLFFHCRQIIAKHKQSRCEACTYKQHKGASYTKISVNSTSVPEKTLREMELGPFASDFQHFQSIPESQQV